MKYKLSIGILVLCVSVLVFMSNASASIGPGAWINQATLSIIDSNPSRDPENSGFGTIQVAVWEEWNGNDWDINMKYSLFDGALGTWVFPPVHPATTPDDEINPAVTVTNADITGVFQIHVVYEWYDGAQWNINHTYTLNMGINWIIPAGNPLNRNEAHDPAIVYTEDVSNPGAAWYGMAVQIVWSEQNAVTTNYDIWYNAWCFDVPSRGWFYAGVNRLQVSTATTTYERPEIASVDDTILAGTWDYFFGVVWQGQTAAGQWNIYYLDGTTTTTTGAPPTAAVVTTPVGMLNSNVPGSGDCYDPDIAATQDYQNPGIAPEEFYYHVNWVFMDTRGAFVTYQIDTTYVCGPAPIPGALAFLSFTIAVGPIVTVLNRPTIASKLIARLPWQGSTIFETWMCWEDNSNPASIPDIWYRVGQYNNVAPPFGYVMAAAPVPYIPAVSSDYNPELWNRNDAIRPVAPPFTHLVFDQGIPVGAIPEVVYIDP